MGGDVELLEGDPAIRWQVLAGLTDASESDVAAERSRVATEGWGKALLDRQSSHGHWDDGNDDGWISQDENKSFQIACRKRFTLVEVIIVFGHRGPPHTETNHRAARRAPFGVGSGPIKFAREPARSFVRFRSS